MRVFHTLPFTCSTMPGSTRFAFSLSNATRAFSLPHTTPGTIAPLISSAYPHTVASAGIGNSKSALICRELGLVKVNVVRTRR